MAYSDKEIIEKIEAEARKIKPKVLSSKRSAFLNQKRLGGGSGDCYVYYGQDTGAWLNKNPPDGNSIVQIATASDKTALLTSNGITGVNSNGSSAKYGNKAYEFFHQPSNIIVEFIIDAINDTLSFGQAYTPPTSYPSGGGSVTAACAKDSNTMLIVRSQLAEIIEINLQPGGTYTYNTLFTISNNLSGGTDMVYRPSDNTIFVVVLGSSGEELHQYSYNGTLLDSVSINSLNFPNMMFCHGGKIFIHDLVGTNGEVYEIGTNPLSLLPSTISYSQPGNAGDAASSPECCDGGGTTSTECYDIGDTGPEGGTIFAVPLGHPQNNGVNQTNYYYEVAKNDIAIGGTPSTEFNLTCGPSTVTQQVQVLVTGHLGVGNVTDLYVGMPITGPNIAPGSTIVSITGGLVMLSPGSITGGPYTVTDPFFITYQIQGTPGWTASGAEWGVHDKPNIATSTDFGTGHKNTDTIDAYPLSPGNPTGGIHPWLDTHDIAATICKQHPSAKDDWFLPSRDEFIEMVDASNAYGFPLNLNPLGQFSEHQYWTSSHYRPDPALNWQLPPQFPDKYSWTIKSNGAPGLAYRCHALSVRPIRRFECEVEPDPVNEGITYDYRLSHAKGISGTSGSHFTGAPGTIQQIGNGQGLEFQDWANVPAYVWLMTNSQSTSGTTGSVLGPGVIALFIDSTVSSVGLPSIGDTVWHGNCTSLVDQIYDISDPAWGQVITGAQNAIGVSVDTALVFLSTTFSPGCSGPGNLALIGQNFPIYSFYDNISWYQSTLNPNYQTPAFSHPYQTNYNTGKRDYNYIMGYSNGLNTGSDAIEIGWQTLVIQASVYDVQGNDNFFGPSGGTWSLPTNRANHFVGETFNIKIYDNFEVLIADYDYVLSGVHHSGCQNNRCYAYMAMDLISLNYKEDNGNPSIVNLAKHFGGRSTLEGGPSEGNAYVALTCKTNISWHKGPRGNTLNLQNWLGTGINQRITDPINLPSNWNNSRNQLGWGVICHPCGEANNGCMNVIRREYLGEIPYVNNNSFSLPTCANYPNLAYPLFNVYQFSYGSYSDNGFYLAEQAGCGMNSRGPSSKIAAPSSSYEPLVNECFNDPEVDELSYTIVSKPVYTEVLTKRQEFINDKKPKETGPFGILGYYPLYDTIEAAVYNSPTPIESRTGENTHGYHIHDFLGQEYYMPNGLEMGKTQFHGDYDGQIIPETTAQPETIQPEQPSVVTITPIEPEQEEELPAPTPTYTPPPPSTPSGGSGGGGY